MADLILDNTYLILLLPLWIFLIIMVARFFAIYVNKKIIYALTLLSSFLGILFSSLSIIRLQDVIEQSFQFLKINDFALYFGLHIDKLSLIMAIVLFTVSFLVQWFSISYMKNEDKNYRFYAYLNLFNFSMAGLIFSPNLFQLYVFWELVGIISYLLIGFDYKNKSKSEASRRVFLINRIGDTCLISGIILSSYLMYNYAGNHAFTSLSFVDMNAISTLISAYTSTPVFYFICFLFIIGASVKSAQFPFYTWLQDAMEAKLPVSALLHSSTMVVAGAFLLTRLIPLFSLNSSIMQIIAYIGIITALICSILASIETHPKKVLAYSTSSNLGLIFVAIGFMNIKAAVIFLVAHAFIKSMLFLSLEDYENYINYVTFLLGGLSLSGLIFSGVIAKEVLFNSILANNVFSILYCIVAFFTAFYIMRIPLIMIKDKSLLNKINLMKYSPVALLFFANILFYFFIREKVEYKIAEPYWIALFGWGVVYFLYTQNLLTKFNNTPKLLENFYNKVITTCYNKITLFCNYIEVQVFGNYKIFQKTAKFCVKTVGWTEDNIMNGVVNLTVNSNKKFSEIGERIQTKNIQNYNAYAFIILTIIVTSIILIYKLLLSQMS